MFPNREQNAATIETVCRRIADGRAVVRLPRTSGRRGGITHIQILRGLALRTGSGTGFDGPHFCAGEWIPESELCAGRDGDAIVIECAEFEGGYNSQRKQRRWEVVYIVWRYAAGEWEEIARTTGERTQVIGELRAIAERALGQRTWRIVPTVVEAAERIRELLERQLVEVEPGQRAAVLAILHDEVIAWMVAG